MVFITSLADSFTDNLTAEQRYRMIPDGRQVVEEPTERGFRVKLII